MSTTLQSIPYTTSVQVTDGMIMAASEALAACNSPEELAAGRIYPGLSDIRSISARYPRQVQPRTLQVGQS